MLATFTEKIKDSDDPEIIDEESWQDLRLIVAHNQQRATEQTDQRDQKIAELEALAE